MIESKDMEGVSKMKAKQYLCFVCTYLNVT